MWLNCATSWSAWSQTEKKKCHCQATCVLCILLEKLHQSYIWIIDMMHVYEQEGNQIKVKLNSCASVNSEQLTLEKIEILWSGNVGTYGNHVVKEHELTFYQGLLSSFSGEFLLSFWTPHGSCALFSVGKELFQSLNGDITS